MKYFKAIFKHIHSRVWVIVTCVVLVVLLAFNIVAMGIIPKVFDNLFGGDVSSGRSDDRSFELDEGITDKATAKANGDAVTKEVCEEGFVLLKNEGVLPLKTSADAKKKVSVFGKNSVNLVYGGSGSGAGNTAGAKSIYDSLSAANYEYNPQLKTFYESSASGTGRPADLSTNAGTVTGFATGETPVSSYSQTLRSSFSQFGDLALVVISRTCGESYDVPTTMKKSDGNKEDGAYSADDHYLELDRNEQDMLEMVCESFDKVLLVINSSQTFELGFLDDVDDNDDTVISYDFASKIDGAIWIGGPGGEGIMALGEIMNGSVNPSGRTVDTYARDFTKSPAYQNIGVSAEGKLTSDVYYVGNSGQDGYYFSDYEEGVYVGYRYYETRALTDGNEWYKNNVVYPFGYGLSYTSFNWTFSNKDELNNTELKADSTVSVKVKVENVGEYAGKDVVQLYVSSPYTPGGIEKAHKVLCAFSKTELLAAENGVGEVTLTFDAYDIANYDYDDANKNGNKGYELDKGNYTFYISKNSHEEVDSFVMEVKEDILFKNDTVTGNTVTNVYEDLDSQLGQKLSRSNWEETWPKQRTMAERTVDQAFIDSVNSKESHNPLTSESEEVKNADLTVATKKDKNSTVKLAEMVGVELGNTEKWDKFLAGVTLSTMQDTLNMAAFGTSAIDYIGKPKTIEPDGPVGFTQFMGGGGEVSGTCAYASECVLGSTFNVELAEKVGKAIGNEGIIGHVGSGGTLDPYSGWSAPGVNIHRTPFGGRNYEYYSEDPSLNGFMAANTLKGAWDKGVYAYMKHFVANEQETHRNGVCTWMTEQTLREIYLKPFEIAVKKSKNSAHGVMSSFNRLGATWTGGDYRLLTTILRDEWGFEGAVICDFKTGSYMDNKQMAYAGGDIYLNNVPATNWVNKNNKMDVYVIRNNFKNYMYLIANSNALNGVSDNYSTRMANWKIAIIAIDCVAAISLAVWGLFAVRSAVKKMPGNGEAAQDT